MLPPGQGGGQPEHSSLCGGNMRHPFQTITTSETQNSTGQDEQTQSHFQTEACPCPKRSCQYSFGLSLTQIPGMVLEVIWVPLGEAY